MRAQDAWTGFSSRAMPYGHHLPARLAALLCLATAFPVAQASSAASQSQCYGTVSHGRIENSVKLPVGGSNFSAYSQLGSAIGRTYVHRTVAAIVTNAYAALAISAPAAHYVLGETGLREGGRFRPHRSHQNGLSVDFFVPVRGGDGRPASLTMNVTNRFGYDLEFDAIGVSGEYRIDFDALAEHLFQLDASAQAQGFALGRVIIDRRYLPMLFAAPRGSYLREHLTFMKTQPWVRHDEHYHVDFAIPCKPL